MYFPYLRGRQNELLCLKELLEVGKLGEKIVPIIEPVRFNSTLFSVLTKFMDMHRAIILIVNPKVGSFNKEYADILRKAVEWGKEQQKKIMNEKSEQIANALMEEMTPLILQRKAFIKAELGSNEE